MNTISEIEIQGNQIVLDDTLAAEVNKWGQRLKGYIDGNQLVIVPAGETPDPNHPLISSYQGIGNGEPVIAGTRVTVRAIVEYDRMYHDIARTMRAIPHVSQDQIQDALAYFEAHTAEIEKYIEENEQAYDEGAKEA